MANIKSAKKRAKQAVKRRFKNLNRKTAVKSAIKKVETALEAGESKDAVIELMKDAEGRKLHVVAGGNFILVWKGEALRESGTILETVLKDINGG